MRQWGNKRLLELLHARTRPGGGGLSTVKLTRHQSVVGRSLIHRSDPLTWPRATISFTLGALLSRLVRPIRERIWWYVRVEAVDWPVLEHCAAVLTPPGGGPIAHLPSGYDHLPPRRDNRCSRVVQRASDTHHTAKRMVDSGFACLCAL
jgi:hypothetical protein